MRRLLKFRHGHPLTWISYLDVDCPAIYTLRHLQKTWKSARCRFGLDLRIWGFCLYPLAAHHL